MQLFYNTLPEPVGYYDACYINRNTLPYKGKFACYCNGENAIQSEQVYGQSEYHSVGRKVIHLR